MVYSARSLSVGWRHSSITSVFNSWWIQVEVLYVCLFGDWRFQCFLFKFMPFALWAKLNQATGHSPTSAPLSLTLSCGPIGWLLLIFLNVNIGVLWGPMFGSFLFPVFSYSFDFLYGFQILSHIAYNLPICIFSHNSPNAPRIESLTSHFISPCRVQGSQGQHI